MTRPLSTWHRATSQLVLILRSHITASTCSAAGSYYLSSALLSDTNLISVCSGRHNHIWTGEGGARDGTGLHLWEPAAFLLVAQASVTSPTAVLAPSSSLVSHELASKALSFVSGLMLLSQLGEMQTFLSKIGKLPHDPSEFMKGQRFSLPGSDSALISANFEGVCDPFESILKAMHLHSKRGGVVIMHTQSYNHPRTSGHQEKPKLPPLPYLGQIIYMNFHRCSSPSYKICRIGR